MGRSKYSGKSVSEAAYEMLREANRSMHAKELVQRLVEGGLQIKGKTPLTSVATSLKRDKRFKKVGPNTFEALEESLIHAVLCVWASETSKYTKGGESLGDEESSKEEEEVVPALILASGARPLAPDVKSHSSNSHVTIQLTCCGKTTRRFHLQEDER
jgi:hypothetical protein